jgi:Skp family chaperone for outer membrane proteins
MKKRFLLVLLFVVTLTSNAQKGVKIGYIDMDYILENVPDYKEASVQLEQKAQKWKQDIEVKKNDITKLKDVLKTERALLTKELIEEREEEIKFIENDLLDYQQKRFGPNGDLMIQKASIIKPIQDQVFTAVQDIAEAKGYDFIFDKSSDLTMLFSAKRYDVSDQVVRTITRAGKREEMSKKQLKAEAEKESKEDVIDQNPEKAERKKILDDKRAAREKAIEERKQEALQKKKEFEENRKKLQEAQQAKKEGKTVETTTTGQTNPNNTIATVVDSKKAALDSLKAEKEKIRLETIEKNKKGLEERKKALEEKKKKIADDKEAARKAKEEELKKKKEEQKPKN